MVTKQVQDGPDAPGLSRWGLATGYPLSRPAVTLSCGRVLAAGTRSLGGGRYRSPADTVAIEKTIQRFFGRLSFPVIRPRRETAPVAW